MDQHLQIQVHVEEKNITTHGTWISIHAELEPNELADKHTKLAAEEARECSCQSSTSLSEAKSAVKLMTLIKWQRGCHKSDKGLQLYSLLPSVKRSSFKSIHNRTAERKINRLRGHTNLKADLAHKKIIENPMCKCELARETPFHCKGYNTQRESHINSMELMYVQKQVPYLLRTIDFDTLVGFNNQHSLEVRYHIAKSISTFLCSITSSI